MDHSQILAYEYIHKYNNLRGKIMLMHELTMQLHNYVSAGGQASMLLHSFYKARYQIPACTMCGQPGLGFSRVYITMHLNHNLTSSSDGSFAL